METVRVIPHEIGKPIDRKILSMIGGILACFAPRVRRHDHNSIAHNRDLSRRRADSVKRYLVEHGIDTARIETRGAGPDEPVDSNRTPAGRARNRRIEFNLIVGPKP